MTKKHFYSSIRRSSALVAIVFALAMQGFAQKGTTPSPTPTSANTDIKNVANGSYSDGTNTYTAVSNEVVVTVAAVAGIAVTPDGQTNSTVVPGQTNVPFTFRVTNVGNFTDLFNFLANGGSLVVTGPATITSATVDGNDILTNASDVIVKIDQNGFVDVSVNLTISSSAASGDTIQVFLGDSTTGTNFDNVKTDGSGHDLSTVSKIAVNGPMEGRGDISVVVDTDALVRVNLTAPTGPVALGGTIVYDVSACNDGLRDLTPLTKPAESAIYIYAPIPAGTVLASYPVDTEFTTDPLTTDPLSATWTTTTPSLETVTRIRIPIGKSLAAGACSSPFSYSVTVVTDNANASIYEIVDVFGSNSVGATITDQSGDKLPNQGDGNASFDEPIPDDKPNAGQGVQQPTTLLQEAGVLLGPENNPNASGPGGTNFDFTNQGVTTGIAVAASGVTTEDGVTVFTNTVQNTGNSDDTFTLTAPTVPAGFTVRISTDGGETWVDVTSGGSTTIDVAFGKSANFLVEITEPAGQTVLTGFDTVIRATSGIDPKNVYNDTIDRLYTGFIKLEKSFTIDNQTGVGGPNDAVPGAEIVYTITYTNISLTDVGYKPRMIGNKILTASNLVITEDGGLAPNTWGATTTQVVGSAEDSRGGTITGDVEDSNLLTVTVPSLAPEQWGVFTFRRRINDGTKPVVSTAVTASVID
jgi:hypothetical protein